MEPPLKRIKETPVEIWGKILNYAKTSEIKNVYELNWKIYREISFLRRNKTYLYIDTQQDVNDVLSTQREFNEIFFHGKQQQNEVEEVLKKFGHKLSMLGFGKCDLNFISIPSTVINTWLNYARNLTHLNTANIKMTGSPDQSMVLLKCLKKLLCDDKMLTVIYAPSLDKLKVYSTDSLTQLKLDAMNAFLARHHLIKKIAFTLYNGEDVEVQNCSFNLAHLKLKILRLLEFRYDINAVINILKSQGDLIELKLEDGAYSESYEDSTRVASFPPLFDQILQLKKLQNLYIEMPSDTMMNSIPIILKNLTVLKICSITSEMLDTFQHIKNDKVQKLCIENIEHGKKHLEASHIINLSKSYPNLQSFKIDTLPPAIINCISVHMKQLKKLKIIRNEFLPNKMKKAFSENVEMHKSNLEKITCRHEDYKLRVLPLISAASATLKEVKVFWDNKHTPFMQIIFEILIACPLIDTIKFIFDGVYVKTNVISFKSNFDFSYNNRCYEVLISRKKGKIICKKCNY